MRRFRVPRKSALTEKALRELYARSRSFLAKASSPSLIDVLARAQSAMAKFFTTLGKPTFSFKPFKPTDPLDPERVAGMTEAIASDIAVSYDEVRDLREAAVQTHNYGQLRIAELKRRAEEVSGLVDDLRLLSNGEQGEVLVFSDRFKDASKLDFTFRTDRAPCDVMSGQGSLTLNRVGSLSVPAEDILVDVKVLSPTSASRSPTTDNTKRFYEGHFHAFLGSAEPEGGRFHIDESIDPASLEGIDQAAFEIPEPAGKDGKYTPGQLRNFVVPGGLQAQFYERLQSGLYGDLSGKRLQKFIKNVSERLHRRDRRRIKAYAYLVANPDKGSLPSSDIPLGPENLVAVDMGASAQELQAQRQKMLDGDPASYWQCEYAIKTNVLQDFVNSQPFEDENLENVPQETREHLGGGLGKRRVSPDDLKVLAASGAVDSEDLEIEILMTLKSSQILNWITLSPMNFDEGVFVEVTDVSTAPDMNSGFVPVESFVDRSSPNILTGEVNEELPEDVASMVLAPNRYSYRGTGVWSFSARQVKMVRFRLKQRVPVPSPYESYAIETTRSLTNVRRRRANG